MGITCPETVEDARTALDTYTSLHDEDAKPPKARMVQDAADGSGFMTQRDLERVRMT